MATLIDRVARHVAARPDAVAVEDARRQLTYRELWDEAEALAPAVGGLTAIDGLPSVDAIVALLAVHRAGSAFLFLDPDDPPARRDAVLALTGAVRFGDAPDDPTPGDPTPGDPTPGDPPPGDPPPGDPTPGDPTPGDPTPGDPTPGDPALAYCVSTSGSSGRPKVVRVGHRGVVPMLDAQIAALGIEPHHRVLLGTPLRFDASVSDIGCALVAGARLCIPPRRTGPELMAFVRERGVTHADLPPATMAALEPWPSLEVALVGGEVVPAAVLTRWARRVRVLVAYGPTEATVCASLARVDPDAWRDGSIGDPLPHVRFRLEGEELWIGGDAVALGYVGGDHGRFVDGWFRTGDRVRREGDGSYTFLGRVDRQRKLDGRLFRPEEVEAALASHPAVREVAVAFVGGRPVTFVAPPVDQAALRAHAAHLPPRWIGRLVARASLPRGATGKIDRAALVASLEGTPGGDDLRAIASRLLGVEVGWDDDLVDLGATSATALELTAALAGRILEPSALYTARTPRRLEAAAEPTAWPTAVIDDRIAPHRGAPITGLGSGTLFTGVTGRLGGRLLRAWLRRTDAPAWALVRARSDEEASRRLDRVFERLAIPPELRPRVTAWAGDLSRPRLGWAAPVYAPRRALLGEVVHAAAALDVTAPWAPMAAVNVRGTAEVARFGRLHLVSTLAVFLAAEGAPARIDEATPLDAVTQLHGAYAATKWAAERLGYATSVHRLGLLTGEGTNALVATVRGLARLGVYPDGSDLAALRFDLTPIDQAAEAIVSQLVHGASGVHHVSSTSGATAEALVQALRDEGRPLTPVPTETFVARARSDLSLDAAWTLVAWGARVEGRPRLGFDPFLLTGRVLHGGAAIAEPSPDDLRRFVRAALEGT